MQGEDALEELRKAYPELPVVILTQRDSLRASREFLLAGAGGYVLKAEPGESQAVEIEIAITRAVRAANLNRYRRRFQPAEGLLVGQSLLSKKVLREFQLWLPSNKPVLILGEPGTGKKLFAAEFHRQRHRRPDQWFALDARESEDIDRALFAGGFLLGAAAGCTLLIEHAELLERSTWKRLDSADTNYGRILFTARQLDEKIPLLRRAHVLRLPNLDHRREDIPALAQFFLDRYDDAHPPLRHIFEPAAAEVLKLRNYPFNLSDLQAVVEDAAMRAEGERIGAADIQAQDAGEWDPRKSLEDVLDRRLSWLKFCKRHKAHSQSRMDQEFLWFEALRDELFFERYGRQPSTKEFLDTGELPNTANSRKRNAKKRLERKLDL
jgi:two-component system NtrC family response regulator